MTQLKVPDMHCEMCVKRITNSLNDAKLNFSVSLQDKSVRIDGDENAVKAAILALDDIGFEAKQD